jgi:imidazolonepropionase
MLAYVAMNRFDSIIVNARLCTLSEDSGYGLVESGAVASRDGRIAYVGPASALADRATLEGASVFDAGGGLLTPALIDCHTHLVFAGDRSGEFEQRLAGRAYSEIAQAGGGILGTVDAVRATSEDELLAQSLPRARALMASGVATLEIKSGYGLDLDSELKLLRVARRIGSELAIDVRTTLLAAHAVPREFAGRADDYVDEICQRMLPAVVDSGLADAVDAFCEGIGFSADQVQRVFRRARELGLPVKLHADQLSNLGGAALCASFSGLSADHLEYTDEDGVRAMARAGTVAVLLPGAFFCLNETRKPPVALFRETGVTMAIATDCNPGTSPLVSMTLAMGLACASFRLTPEEALRGATVNAARALGVSDRGRLAVGQRADLALWDARHPAQLSYWLGGTPLRGLWLQGQRSPTNPIRPVA